MGRSVEQPDLFAAASLGVGSHESEPGPLWLLTLVAFPWGRFHARDLHKTNRGWVSYPLLPPTTADGCLAAIAAEERWLEGNFQPARRLRDSFGQAAALGAYPQVGQPSRMHYRAHVGTRPFNYEAHVFVAGQGVGKKLAGVQDTICDRLLFHVVSPDSECLSRLHAAVRGRVSPSAKKGMLQFAWEAEPYLRQLTRTVSAGEMSPTAVPMLEIGSLPTKPPIQLPISSRSEIGPRGISSVAWRTIACVWEPKQRIREGVTVWSTLDGEAISSTLINVALE